MIWIITSVVGLILLFTLRVILTGRRYIKVYAPKHYREFAESLTKVTAAACVKIGEPPAHAPTDDPRGFVTSAGLLVFYTIAPENGGYRHHFSISMGPYTPRAVGGTFVIYLARLLAIDLQRLLIGVSQRKVFHAQCILSRDEQVDFKTRQIEIPSIEAAQQIHVECFQEYQGLTVELIES